MVFVVDVAMDIGSGITAFSHILPEVMATAGLAIGMMFGIHWARHQLLVQKQMMRRLDAAGSVLSDLMEGYFRQWSLTAAEKDVATFTIKGYSIGEIGAMRGSAEGTVKAHLNAIYRKAGVQGRGELVSVLIEDLMNTPLLR